MKSIVLSPKHVYSFLIMRSCLDPAMILHRVLGSLLKCWVLHYIEVLLALPNRSACSVRAVFHTADDYAKEAGLH